MNVRTPGGYLGEPVQRPDPRRCRARLGEPGQRAFDVLSLAALPPRRYHAAPGRPVGHLAAVVPAHDVQAQVDAGADSGRCEHLAVVYEQHVRVEGDLGEQPPEAVGV